VITVGGGVAMVAGRLHCSGDDGVAGEAGRVGCSLCDGGGGGLVDEDRVLRVRGGR